MSRKKKFGLSGAAWAIFAGLPADGVDVLRDAVDPHPGAGGDDELYAACANLGCCWYSGLTPPGPPLASWAMPAPPLNSQLLRLTPVFSRTHLFASSYDLFKRWPELGKIWCELATCGDPEDCRRFRELLPSR
jgi:hypothetical protein